MDIFAYSLYFLSVWISHVLRLYSLHSITTEAEETKCKKVKVFLMNFPKLNILFQGDSSHYLQ